MGVACRAVIATIILFPGVTFAVPAAKTAQVLPPLSDHSVSHRPCVGSALWII